MVKKTLVLGVSLDPKRHSYRTVAALADEGFPVVAIGNREGVIDGVRVETGMPVHSGIHTVTMYLSPVNQRAYYEYILQIKPQRLIFNKKTENEVLMESAMNAGIEVVEGCTLAMIAKGTF
jgi:hypothetical protein